jgi:hypothetical protein
MTPFATYSIDVSLYLDFDAVCSPAHITRESIKALHYVCCRTDHRKVLAYSTIIKEAKMKYLAPIKR